MPHEDYNRKIREVARDQANNSSMKGMPTGKVLYHTFENLFYLQHEVKHLFVNKPTFAKSTEADEVYKILAKIKLPDTKTWEKLNDLQLKGKGKEQSVQKTNNKREKVEKDLILE